MINFHIKPNQTNVAMLFNHIIILNEFWKGKQYTYLNLTSNFPWKFNFLFLLNFSLTKITLNSISPRQMRCKNHEITSMQPYPLKAFQE
jgi:hypothetical protein